MPDQVDAASGNIQTPPTPPDLENQEQAIEQAQEDVDKSQKRIRDLEATRVGRTNKRLEQELERVKADAEAAQNRLNEVLEANRRLQEGYYANAPEEEKQRIRRQAEARTISEAERIRRENATLKALVDEENPIVQSFLKAALKKGEPLTRKQIDALRDEFDTLTEEEEEEKGPPKVTPVRSTGTQGPTLAERKEKAKKDRNLTEMLNVMAEEQKLRNSGAA